MEPLFPENWRERVRAFLAPFEVDCVWPSDQRLPKEILKQMSCYDLQQVSVEYNEARTFEGIFTLGASSLFIVATARTSGSEESMTCIWSDKTFFATPLQFWAGACLVWSYLGSMWQNVEPYTVYMNFQFEPKSLTIDSSHPIFSAWPKHLWPHQWDSVPQVTQEQRMRGWKISDEGYEIGELWETEQSYFTQQWDTSA